MRVNQRVKPAADTYPRILACGDSALSIELHDSINDTVNERVIALAQSFSSAPVSGVDDVVPTYRSVMVTYDPVVIRGEALRREIQQRLSMLPIGRQSSRRIIVPVLYGGDAGLDLDALAEMKGLRPEKIIELHASADYRVHMIGFAPGFAYLGGLPDILHTPRLAAPRQRVEAGSIGIGGQQASINSVAGPSGWRFIGRTPLRVFDPARPNPFLLMAGDIVRFHPISASQASEMDHAIADGCQIVKVETS
ncbi:5-oxoprolinase subunit PxpB [Rhizobium sp.]|jgi:KipI family sensor histidine kinase inhibitor|uniref:5-oxoprolinase subunit PxpB n=1 Tax=Rhizobium sp. TaxID=391 RepID=UPI000E957918|nr:allophanate hydrolase [Rhizobium sp.]